MKKTNRFARMLIVFGVKRFLLYLAFVMLFATLTGLTVNGIV